MKDIRETSSRKFMITLDDNIFTSLERMSKEQGIKKSALISILIKKEEVEREMGKK